MKTYSARPKDIEREWFVVDAAGIPLGRLATRVAHILRGKHKTMYTPSMDVGDHIVIINAEKIAMTGRKAQTKMYYRHSGYIGGLKEMTFEKLQAKHPERILELAIKGMLPHNSLGRAMFRKLKVYAGTEHPHSAQQPKILDIMAEGE
ncbi:MAG: 50S ribosomal protein L13 [Actinomycetota bacterium]|uniref:Large ribosomal subunit protein uL13 n=1 Tax=Candidatus Aquicultor primus TaxID=1797195 RepID=A0A1F2USR9_9ACTN|nr:50S ribosomal protein L13 [Actinomycetota bacterium]OFW35998.1 MAG: 50S ribosomal protein L13 [Candidatus Aquicultor primus]HCH00023.1 50S ribosomal protein L13 [Actinomycetota bacterium]